MPLRLFLLLNGWFANDWEKQIYIKKPKENCHEKNNLDFIN